MIYTIGHSGTSDVILVIRIDITMLFSSKQNLKNAENVSAMVGASSISSSDSEMLVLSSLHTWTWKSMHTLSLSLCISAYLQLQKIGRIRKLLTADATTIQVKSFVISKLDQCSSLLDGISKSTSTSSKHSCMNHHKMFTPRSYNNSFKGTCVSTD